MELTQKARSGNFILSLGNGSISFSPGILASGQNLIAATVLGQTLLVAEPDFDGVPGTRGTITVSNLVGPDTRIGSYRLICVSASTDAGTFRLHAPDGSIVNFAEGTEIEVGAGAFTSNHLGITIEDGETDFIVGDSYAIHITAEKYSALDPEATDGLQVAAGVLYANTDATDADVECLAIARNGIIKAAALIWPDAITDETKAAALARLASQDLIAR